MNILSVTNLFPDSSRPYYATFNRQQLASLAENHQLRVITPIPWPRYLKLSFSGSEIAPPPGMQSGLEVYYPVYYYTPRILRRWYGRFYLYSISSIFGRLVKEQRPDILYATWAYPDCYAVSILSRRHGLKLVSRVHGSDINDYFRFPRRKRLILDAMISSDAVISVSEELKRKLVNAGVKGDRIQVVLNGVDKSIFRREERLKARDELSLTRDSRIILFAGNLKEVKGLPLLLRAFETVYKPGVQLHILGDGPLKSMLKSMIRGMSCSGSVFMHGTVDHNRMGKWFNASDLFCLPSLNEGTPNVLLESLACGVPVVASDAGGIPDIIDRDSGILFPAGDEEMLAGALAAALERDWNRERVRCPAGTWEENAAEVSDLFSRVIG